MEIVRKKNTRIVLLLFFMLPFVASSQESDLGNWLIYIGNKKVNDQWNVHNEVQYRNYDALGDLEQLLLRTGLGYSFNDKKNNFLLGYGYILSENYIGDTDEKVAVNEHRFFQQFTSKQTVNKVKLNHRYRFEQRFVETDFKMRLRYFLGINIPLNSNENFYLSTYNEIFLNTESSVFDRNRLYGGLGFKFNQNLRVEAGYMNQIFETTGRDQVNILCFFTF